MREILFRGKRKDNGEWVEGQYYKQTHYYGDQSVKHYIITSTESLEFDQALEYFEVDPDTVGQYIGADDNDKRKVFEGDVLERTGPFGVIERIVIDHADGGSSFWYTTILPSYHNYSDPIDDNEYGTCINWFKIIGNIHDNPELLKGETNNEG